MSVGQKKPVLLPPLIQCLCWLSATASPFCQCVAPLSYWRRGLYSLDISFTGLPPRSPVNCHSLNEVQVKYKELWSVTHTLSLDLDYFVNDLRVIIEWWLFAVEEDRAIFWRTPIKSHSCGQQIPIEPGVIVEVNITEVVSSVVIATFGVRES